MTKEGGDDHDFETGATNATPEQTAAIYAAMMEELGIARKDTLPLEDKKGTGGHVDLNALDREKKANNPRTAEFRIAQKNASAHSAWKTAVFDDVDEADLELDQMNSGQSHRQRMKAELEASKSSRGSFAARGGRGGQFARGGGSRSPSRNNQDDFSGHITTKPVRVDIGKVLTRLGGHLGPRGRANRGMRGSLPRDNARPFKPTENVIAPKSNLSFGDNRSVTALPFGRDVSKKSASVSDKGSRESQAASKVVKPSNYTQGFALASPEEFFAHSWIGRSGNDVSIEHTKEKMAPRGSPNQVQAPKIAVDNTSRTKMRSPAVVAVPSSVSTGFQKPPERPIVESLVDNSNDLFHPIPVQISNDIKGKVVTIGPGSVCIKAVGQSPNIAKIIQVLNQEKKYLEEPLLGSFEFKLDLCTISFYSGFEATRTKWILTASHSEVAASLAEAFERLKPQSTNVESVGSPVKDDANSVEERGNLISFSDEDSTPQQAVSQFTEDLFSLMGAEFIAHAVNAINLNIRPNYASEAESGFSGTCKAEIAQAEPKKFRGLATSRFANQVEVGHFLNRSAIFQKLPDSTAAYIREQVSKGVFEETQKDSHDQEVVGPIMRKSQLQYSFKTLMGLRFHPNSSKKPLGLDLHVRTTPKGEPRRLFSSPELEYIVPEGHGLPVSETNTQSNLGMACLGMPIVSDYGIPRKLPGLAASESASSHTLVTAQEYTEPKEQEPSAVEIKPETFSLENTDPRLPRPIQGLSASKYAGPTAESRARENSNPKKPRSSSEKPTPAFISSNSRQNCALKESKSFLNLQENQSPRRRPLERLSNSYLPSTSNVKPLLELSAPSHSKASPSLKPLSELPAQDLREPFARKPYQGLASSKYASPLPMTHSATKTSLSALLQGGPKIPSTINKSLIMKTVVPDLSGEERSPTGAVALADVPRPSIFSMIMSSKEGRKQVRNDSDHKVLNEILENGVPLSLQYGDLNTLRRCPSIKSHASKDANETVKPLVSKPSIKTDQNHAALFQSSRATLDRQLILSMDSSVGRESFATAIEETSTAGKAPDTNNQALVERVQSCHFEPGMPDLLLFPDDTARPEAHGKERDTKSLYSSDMSELMREPLPAATQRDPTNANLASLFQPFNVPTVQPRKLVIKPHGGLQSSRYATPTANIAPAATKAKPQQVSANLPNEVKRGRCTEGIALMPPIRKFEPNTSSRDLKPTASNFTPSATRSRDTQVRNGPPPIMSTFSPPMQPVIATVFVPDPHNPGMLIEVSGLLKLGSTPVVGYVAAAESPMGESLVSGSKPDDMVLSQRALLPTVIQNSMDIKDTQKEVQERLTKSLMDRRLS